MKAILRSRAMAVGLAIAIGGCAEPTPEEYPDHAIAPDGWVTVESRAGDLRLDLPPWMVAFDRETTIFANEPPRPGQEGFMQLLAEGPRTATPQLEPGGSLARWLEARIGTPEPSHGTTRRIILRIGRGVVVERELRPGTRSAWRLAAYAIDTPYGVAYLLIDGPTEAWVGHEADAALIPLLMDVAPGRAGG